MDGLSRLISYHKASRLIRGVQVSSNISLTRVLFVDDVLLFGGNTVDEWQCFSELLALFCTATGMEISFSKSTLIAHKGIIDQRICDIFPLPVSTLEEGFKYLGFSLKPDSYRKKDWMLLWERMDRKVSIWCYRYLTLDGKLILAKSVLESLPVYWLTLFKVPVSILDGIKKRISSLLWSGGKEDDKIHLARWELIARPKNMGGWGLRRLDLFSKALRMKSLWRGLFSDTLWKKVLLDKYIKPQSVEQWLKDGKVAHHKLFVIWRGFMDVLPHIKDHLWWQVGSGNSIRLGIDRIVGLLDGGILSDDLLHLFHDRGYSMLAHFCTQHSTRSFYWLGDCFFRLTDASKDEWSSTIGLLNRAGITMDHTEDREVWYLNKADGTVTVKTAYDFLIDNCIDDGLWWAYSIWDWHLPLKLVCFFWLVLHNRTLTWDNLIRRGWSGPGICILCFEAEETILHLFFHCHFAKEVWQITCTSLRLVWFVRGGTVDEIVRHWFRYYKRHRRLIFYIYWGLWRCRNATVFRSQVYNVQFICNWILGLYALHKGDTSDSFHRKRLIEPLSDLLYPIAFFDGAAQGLSGGVGCRFWITLDHHYDLWMGLEQCTNNCSEIIALWVSLYWAKVLGITDLRIRGDSMVIIDWFNHKAEIHSILLQPWCRSIQQVIKHFTSVSVQHI